MRKLAATMTLRADKRLFPSVLIAKMMLKIVAAFEWFPVAGTIGPLTNVSTLLFTSIENLLILDMIDQMCAEIRDRFKRF